jgi:serine phosphatase RsbU (regulator of sigma subunit)/tetratricopeptide (TPR) repeat protein
MFKRAILFLLVIVCCNAFAVDIKGIDSLKIVVAKSSDTSKVRNLNSIASFFYNVSSYDSALSYAREAIALQKQYIYPKQYAVSCIIIANSFFRKADYDASLKVSFKGLETANKLDDYNSKFFFIVNIANVYQRLHKTELSLGYYLKGLTLAEQKKDTIKIGELYSKMSNLYMDNNNYDLALMSLRSSLNILLAKQKMDSTSFDHLLLASAYTNMGTLMGRYYSNKLKPITYVDSALFYFNKAITIVRKIKNDRRELSILLINTSDAYNTIGDYTKAIDMLMEAMEVASSENYIYQIVIYVNLGDAYRGLNNIQVSIQYLQKALDLARRYNAQDMLSEANLSLSRTFEKVKKYDEAFAIYKKHSNYKDSMLNIQSSGTISETMAKYETDKKEAEIQLLTKDSELQQHEIGKQKVVRNIVLSGLFLILILSALLLGRYQLTKRLNIELDKTNFLIYNKNRLIMESIDYAERIQRLILPPLNILQRRFADSFTVYIPKDVISGDIYWFAKEGNTFLLAAVDCTGHGVPGALMSMVAYNLLNRSVRSGEQANAISVINNMNKGLQNFVARNADKMSVHDGMDISVCSIDLNTLHLNFAGAQNSLYIVRNKQLTELKADQVSIGDPASVDHVFSPQNMQLCKGDWVYLFTDGYADQKGGPYNKKFYYLPFQDMIKEVSDLSGQEQRQKMDLMFHQWKGRNEQLDDVLIIAVKI